MLGHWLVPVERADLEDGTTRRVLDLARSVGARVRFFHALENVPLDADAAIIGAPLAIDTTLLEQVNEAAAAGAAATLARATALAEAAGVPSDSVIGEEALVVDGILHAAAAAGCDLIVMAAHERRGLAGLLHGSESQRLIPRSPVPVLVLPVREPPAAG